MNTYRKTLNAFIYHRLSTFKGVMKLFTFLFAFLSLLLSILPAITGHGNGNSTTSYSFASIGVFALTITFSIIAGSITSDLAMEGMFIFPCKRSIYILGNMISWLIMITAGVIMIGFFQSVSLLVGKVLTNIKGNYLYLTDMTLHSFLLGMVGAVFGILMIISLVFYISISFRQNKWITFGAIAVIVGFIVSIPAFNTFIIDGISKIFFDEIAILLVLKQLLAICLLNFLSYLLMRKKEIMA